MSELFSKLKNVASGYSGKTTASTDPTISSTGTAAGPSANEDYLDKGWHLDIYTSRTDADCQASILLNGNAV